MEVNRSELRYALEKVRPGLASKEVMEQSTSFAFVSGRVVAYNDEISISHPVTGLDLRGAIRADEFYKFLSSDLPDTLNIRTEGSEVLIKVHQSEAGFTLQEEVKLPLDEVDEPGEWKKVPGGFIDGLKMTYPICARDMTKPVLSCVNVTADGRLESSDNIQIMQYSIGKKMPVKTFLIPATTVKSLVNYDITHIAQGGAWIHFKTAEDTIISCRVFEDSYPDVNKLFEGDGVEISLPNDLSDALAKASIFSGSTVNSSESYVKLALSEGSMTVYSEGDAGWFREDMGVDYDDTPFTFTTFPSILKEVAKCVNTCALTDNVIKFAGENWQHAVALSVEE